MMKVEDEMAELTGRERINEVLFACQDVKMMRSMGPIPDRGVLSAEEDYQKIQRAERLTILYNLLIDAVKKSDLPRACRFLGQMGRAIDVNPDPATWQATAEQEARLSNAKRGDLAYLLWRSMLRPEQAERLTYLQAKLTGDLS